MAEVHSPILNATPSVGSADIEVASTATAPTQPLLGLRNSGAPVAPRYYKRKLIGNGSYGEAWLVERAADNAIFVAKSMDLGRMSARDTQYAYSEIKCLANCNHPNIVKYLEDAEEDGHLIIVMEFADSGDLDRQIKARAADNFRYFQEHEALFLFLQVAMALDHIHRHKMLHRDIKGANVLLTSAGLVKLGDFGFSHMYEDTVSAGVANTFCGTPYYLAPELWNNQRYSKKADVWSLGVLLYELMALKRPFTAPNMTALMQKVTTCEYAPLPDRFSAEFRDVVRQLLVVDANARPSIGEIFEIPYVRQGLATLQDTIARNTRISDPLKEQFRVHIDVILHTSSKDHASGVHQRAQGRVGELNREIHYEGAVQKLGAVVNGKAWKERWLILQRGHLILCDAKGEEATGKALSLQHVQSVCPVPVSGAKREHVFSLNTHGGKCMWLQAGSREEMERWMHAVQQALGVA